MKHYNAAKKHGARIALAGSAVLPGLALADGTTSYIPSAASGLFTQMGADFTTLFGYAFGALVVIVGSMLAWRYTRKLGSRI